MKLFGFEFTRVEPEYLKKEPVSNSNISFVDRDSESTSAVIASSFTSGMFIDMSGTLKAEADLVTKYRDMCTMPEIDNAVDEIVNESITTEDDFIVKLDLSDLVEQLDENTRRVIEDEHKYILDMFDFNKKAYWIFRRWYVDGRLYYHCVTDPAHLNEGLKELRYIDPRKIRAIKEVAPKPIVGQTEQNAIAATTQTKIEYYLYNDRGFAAKAPYQVGFAGMATQGVRISKDSVIHVPSGLSDTNTTLGLSYLQKAIKVLSQLKTIEDSLIIYRLARAPERRVWYVDVGNLAKDKADAAVRDIMIGQKNKLIYDAETGAIQDTRKFLTMTEDYWLPRRADGSGTRVETLPAGQTLGQIDDILYFQKLLYNSLNVPIDRLQSDTSPFGIGQDGEISRAEIKFYKFIRRLQADFSMLFRETLKRQLVLKGLLSLEEFESIERKIKYEFAMDTHFVELKDQAILLKRAEAYGSLMQLGIIGKYYSNKTIRRIIFQQTQEDIEEETQLIYEEMNDPTLAPLYSAPLPGQEAAPPEGGDEEPEPEPQPPQDQLSPNDQDAADQEREIKKAETIIKAIKEIPIEKRTPGDKSKLRSAAEKLARAK